MLKAGRTIWHGLRKHATHWVIGGALLAETGFAPEGWLAHTVLGQQVHKSVMRVAGAKHLLDSLRKVGWQR